MDRPQLLKKLESLLDEAERSRQWGNIEVEIRDGRPVVIRRSYTDKIAEENNRGQHNRYQNR